MAETSKVMQMYGIEKIKSTPDVITAINLMEDQNPKRQDNRFLIQLVYEHYTFEFFVDRIIISDKDYNLHCGLKSSCTIKFDEK